MKTRELPVRVAPECFVYLLVCRGILFEKYKINGECQQNKSYNMIPMQCFALEKY